MHALLRPAVFEHWVVMATVWMVHHVTCDMWVRCVSTCVMSGSQKYFSSSEALLVFFA